MKLPSTLVLVAGLLPMSGPVIAQQLDFLPDAGATAAPEEEAVRYTLLMPDDKTSEIIKSEERNPFGKSDDALRELNNKGTNEENMIRDRLAKLRVVGVSPGKNGLRVMLGDMVLEAGQILPPVLADQSVGLKVSKISPEAIELVWVEKKITGLAARGMTLPVDLRPYVRYMLHGQPSEKNQWQKEPSSGEAETIGRSFPEVSHVLPGTKLIAPHPGNTPASADANDNEPSPESSPSPEMTAAPPKESPWDKAVGFLNELVKMDASKK